MDDDKCRAAYKKGGDERIECMRAMDALGTAIVRANGLYR